MLDSIDWPVNVELCPLSECCKFAFLVCGRVRIYPFMHTILRTGIRDKPCVGKPRIRPVTCAGKCFVTGFEVTMANSHLQNSDKPLLASSTYNKRGVGHGRITPTSCITVC